MNLIQTYFTTALLWKLFSFIEQTQINLAYLPNKNMAPAINRCQILWLAVSHLGALHPPWQPDASQRPPFTFADNAPRKSMLSR